MTHKESEHLLQELFDGTIAPEDHHRLEVALTESPDLQKSYRDYALLHGSIFQYANEHQLLANHERPDSVDRIIELRNRRTFKISISAAAAALIVLALVLSQVLAPTPEATLVFRTAPDSIYSLHRAPENAESGDTLSLEIGDTISLNQGTVELTLASGVRSIISAPAKVTVLSETLLSMAEGKGWYHVPKGSEGFEVVTPGLRIVDLGTEFGVISYPGSTDEVHVLKGRVRVTARHGLKKSQELRAGSSRKVDPAGRLRKAPRMAIPFLTTLPNTLPYLHFPFDEVQGNELTVLGNHPARKQLQASMIQSGDHSASSRLIDGPVGKALDFNGLGDYVETNWPGIYGDNPLTISCWVKPNANARYNTIVAWGLGKNQSAGSHQWKIVLTPPIRKALPQRSFRSSWGRGSQVDAKVDLLPNQWHHLTVVFTSRSDPAVSPELRFYLNGERLIAEYPNLPEPPRRPPNFNEAQPLSLGYGLKEGLGDRQFFTGSLDELFIIEGALNDAQVQELYEHNRYLPAP